MDSDAMLLSTVLVVLVALLVGVLFLCVRQSRRGASGAGELGAPLQQLVGGMQLDLRSLAERVTVIDQGQQRAQQGIVELGTGMTRTGTVAGTLAEATAAIREELARAKDDLTALQAYARARHDLELRSAESIRRLEAIIAGTQSKGAAGEHVLELALAKLPPEWQVRDFRVGNKAVEFGLRLPNNLVLPIDSKWPATALLESFVGCDDPEERLRLKGQIESAVLGKAREVQRYLDPSLTVGFGVAAVPDAVYDLCWGVHAEALRLNVVLISYSLFVPYLLLVFQTILKSSRNVDLEKLAAHLQRAQASTAAAQEELEGRFARAVTMLSNSRDDLRRHLSTVNSSLTSLYDGASPPPPPASPVSAATEQDQDPLNPPAAAPGA